MNQNDILKLVAAGVFSAIFSFIISGMIFSPKKYSANVPTIENYSSDFPDVKNDPAYNSYLNPDMIDLTIPVKIGENPTRSSQ